MQQPGGGRCWGRRAARGGRGLGHGDGVASRGAWRGRELPGKAGFKQTRGAGLVLGGGVTRGRPGGRAGVGTVQEGAEVGDEDRGNFVNKSKFKNQFCNFNFSPSSWLQMKKC